MLPPPRFPLSSEHVIIVKISCGLKWRSVTADLPFTHFLVPTCVPDVSASTCPLPLSTFAPLLHPLQPTNQTNPLLQTPFLPLQTAELADKSPYKAPPIRLSEWILDLALRLNFVFSISHFLLRRADFVNPTRKRGNRRRPWSSNHLTPAFPRGRLRVVSKYLKRSERRKCARFQATTHTVCSMEPSKAVPVYGCSLPRPHHSLLPRPQFLPYGQSHLKRRRLRWKEKGKRVVSQSRTNGSRFREKIGSGDSRHEDEFYWLQEWK